MTSQLELWTCRQAVVLFLQYAFIFFTMFVSYFVVDCFRSCAANFVFQCTITINAFYSVLTYLYVYGGDGVSMSQCFIQPPNQGLALVTSWYRLFHCETNSIIREELHITVSAKLPQNEGWWYLKYKRGRQHTSQFLFYRNFLLFCFWSWYLMYFSSF